MAMTFYYGSGSPFSWLIWLVLGHKQLSYELKLMSLLSGELKTPEYLAINPHGKVPVLVDAGLIVWESSVIVTYLEDQYPARPLLPNHPKERAIARRIVAEAHTYLYPPLRRLIEQTLFCTEGKGDRLRLSSGLSFSDLTITGVGRNTLISFGSDELAHLRNVSAASITQVTFA